MINKLEGLDAISNPRFIENRLLMLRQESFDLGSMFANFNKSVSGSIGNMTHFLTFLLTFDGNNKTAEATERLIGATEQKVNRMNYVMLADTALPCPDGFDKDFGGYISTLASERQLLITNAMASLSDFNTYLASFIGDKDSKISLMDNHKKYQTLKVTRETQVKKFESYFHNGVNQRQTLGRMYSGKTDILNSSKESVNLWKAVRVINPKDIEAQCQVISQRLQQVLDLSGGKGNTAVSKQALMNLAEGSYEVARQVENLGLFMVRSETASVTTGNVLERLNKILA